jgi:hypothetical protein
LPQSTNEGIDAIEGERPIEVINTTGVHIETLARFPFHGNENTIVKAKWRNMKMFRNVLNKPKGMEGGPPEGPRRES